MKTHTKTIDGVTYTTKTLPATTGLVILPKLLALFGGPILDAVFDEDVDLTNPVALKKALSEPAMIGGLLASVAKNASVNDGLLVVRDLMASTTADLVTIGDAQVEGSIHAHFDGHFAGRYGHLMAVVMWVASCNFIAP